MADQAQLLPGTLDLLLLRAVSLHTGMFRLVRQGLLESSWDTPEDTLRARFYELKAAGRKRLREEADSWNRLACAITSALSPQSEET